MKYGKLIDNELILAPYQIILNNMKISNPNEFELLEAGYKPIVYKDKPEEEGKEFYPFFYEDEDNIIQEWIGEAIEISEPIVFPNIFELQEQIEALDLENKLAIAELAELILGGTN